MLMALLLALATQHRVTPWCCYCVAEVPKDGERQDMTGAFGAPPLNLRPACGDAGTSAVQKAYGKGAERSAGRTGVIFEAMEMVLIPTDRRGVSST